MERASVVERDVDITQHAQESESAFVARPAQYRLLERLIVEGSDALAFLVCQRLQADRVRTIGPMGAETRTWVEIAEWAKREGLLNADEAFLLQRLTGFMPRMGRAGLA